MNNFQERRSLNELRTFYDERFRRDNLRDCDSFYRWVLQRLRVKSGQSLLDVACGSGRLIVHAQRAGVRAVGLDFSEEALFRERKIDHAAWVVLADGQHIPVLDRSFDFVTNLGSLEHFLDPAIGIREMARIVRPDGLVVILLPNAFYLADLVWWVWRKGRSPSHNQILERFAAHADWQELLEANGLQIKASFRYNFMFPRSQLDWQHYRRFPRKLLNVAIAPFVPFNFSYSFLYVCQGH